MVAMTVDAWADSKAVAKAARWVGWRVVKMVVLLGSDLVVVMVDRLVAVLAGSMAAMRVDAWADLKASLLVL